MLYMEVPEDDAILTGYDYAKEFSVRYTGGHALRYRAWNLPKGLHINKNTGEITGKPRKAGKYTVTVVVKEQGGNLIDAIYYRLTVSDAQLAIDPLANDNAIAGNGYAKVIHYAYTGKRKLKFSAVGLPEGLAIDPETGVILGGTNEIGSYIIVVMASDGQMWAHSFYELHVEQE